MTSFIADEDVEVALRLCEGTGEAAFESAIETGLGVDVSSKTTCAQMRETIATDYAEEDARLAKPFVFLRKSGTKVLRSHEVKRTMKDCVKVVDDEHRYLVLSFEPGTIFDADRGAGAAGASGVEESKGAAAAATAAGIAGDGQRLREEDVEVGRKLGDGAYGDVLLVVLKLLGGKLTIRAAAKKILHAKCTDAKAQLAIKAENARAAKMDHPFVAKAYGSVDMPDGFMIIMELCELGDLKTYVKQNSMSHGLQVQFALQILSAVDYVHTVLRILHRDLAARNFLVTRDEHGVLTVKMCDFGMAREMEGGERSSVYYIKTTLDGGVLNVPVQHTAPEEFGKQEGTTGAKFKATPWGDLWAVGIVLWEMAMRGIEPYVGKGSIVYTEGGMTLTKLAGMHFIADFVCDKGGRLVTPPECPQALRLAIAALCATDPTERPAAGALAVAIAEDGLLRAAREWGILRFAHFIRTEATHIELVGDGAKFFEVVDDQLGGVDGMLDAGDKLKDTLRTELKEEDMSIDDTFPGGEGGKNYRALITELEGIGGLHEAANAEGGALRQELDKLRKAFPGGGDNAAVQALLEARRGAEAAEAEVKAVADKAVADKAAAEVKAAADKAAAEAKAAADKAAADKAAAEAKAAAETEAKAAAAAEAKAAADAAEEAKAADPETAVRTLATSVGKRGNIWEGVKRGGGGEVLEIDWGDKGLNGSLPVGDWGMPALTAFYVYQNYNLKGDLSKVVWPEGLTAIDLYRCEGITGDISVAHFPAGLKQLGLGGCRKLTGDLSKVVWPEGLTTINLESCKGITGDKAAAKAKLEAAGCTVYGL